MTPRMVWMESNQTLVKVLVVIGLIGTCYFGIPMFVVSKFNVILIVIAALISFLYVFRIGNRNMRDVPFLKVFLISGVYFAVSCLLPFQTLSNLTSNFYPKDFFEFLVSLVFLLLQLLYIMGMTILFDIPDIEIDSNQMRTIPQVFGVKSTIWTSITISSIYFGCMAFLFIENLTWLLPILWVHVVFYSFFFYQWRSEFFVSFLGEFVLMVMGVFFAFTSLV